MLLNSPWYSSLKRFCVRRRCSDCRVARRWLSQCVCVVRCALACRGVSGVSGSLLHPIGGHRAVARRLTAQQSGRPCIPAHTPSLCLPLFVQRPAAFQRCSSPSVKVEISWRHASGTERNSNKYKWTRLTGKNERDERIRTMLRQQRPLPLSLLPPRCPLRPCL